VTRNRIVRVTVILTAVLGSGLGLAACTQGPPPCETIEDAPSDAMITSTLQGAEVEKEIPGDYGDAECVVVVIDGEPVERDGDPMQGRWDDQTDDEA
jgi:hypothetical protein